MVWSRALSEAGATTVWTPVEKNVDAPRHARLECIAWNLERAEPSGGERLAGFVLSSYNDRKGSMNDGRDFAPHIQSLALT
jgi:hypothetical protein